MNEWEKKRIGDDCKVGDGAHAKVKRQNAGIMYLTSKNFKDGRLDLSKIDFISPNDYERHFKEKTTTLNKPKTGDVLFSIIGSIGEPYLVRPQDLFGLSSSVSILRANTKIYYWIRGHIFQNALYGIKGGVAQGYVSLEMIKSLPLEYPPLPTQRKIAAILSAYDDLIENNTRRIKILEEMAQALYREWFVKFRYPGHGKVKMVESELGMVPEGWEVRTLADFGKVITGKTPSKKAPENFGGSMPFIKTPDMHGNMFCVQTGEYLSNEGATSQKNKTLPPNSLCVSCIGTAGVVSITSYKAQTNQQINSIVLNLKNIINQYGATGATMVNLNKGKFEALKVICPRSKTIAKFHDSTSEDFDLIKNLLIKNINLRQNRRNRRQNKRQAL